MIKHTEYVKNIDVISYKFTLPNGIDEIKKVDDKRIVDEGVAVERGKAEMIENGYLHQIVELTTTYSFLLNINDIISVNIVDENIPSDLSKVLFIIKSLTQIFNPIKSYTKIKAVRYDKPNN